MGILRKGENMMQKNLNQVTKRILLTTRKEFFLKLLFSILVRVSLLILPIFLSNIIDAVTKFQTSTAIYYLVISIILTIFERVCEYFNQATYYNLYNELYRKYSLVALNSTYQNSSFSLSRFQLGEYSNIMNSDIDVIASFFSNAVLRIVQLAEFLFIYLYFFQLNFYLFFVTVILSIVVFIIILSSGKKIQLKNRKQKEELDQKTNLLHEIFLGMKEIKGFHVFPAIKETVEMENEDYLKASKDYNLSFNRNQIFSLSIIDVFRLILLIFIVFEIVSGHMEVGILLIIYNYYQKIIDNFTMITTVNVEFRTLKVSLGRLQKIFEYSKQLEQKPNVDLKNFEGNITFHNVLYGYRQDPILDHISFSIKANSITIITGKGGSGKSGIFDLLMQFNEPHEGRIQIDDYSIYEINQRTLSRLVSLMKKQPIFFQGSIKDNLLMIEKDFEKIQEITKKLDIHEEIMSLKDGYDTNISEQSRTIPSNLKQLLGIARVLLMDSKIMMFDEATSSLDKKTLGKLMKLFQALKKNHTILLITRESDLLKYADEVIVVDKGKVTFQGPYSKTKQKRGFFQALFHKI